MTRHLSGPGMGWRVGMRVAVMGATAFLLILSACASSPSNAATSATATATTTASGASTPTATSGASTVSSTNLPLGDGHVSLTAQVGYVMLCNLATNGAGGGAFVDGPWIDTTTATWNSTQKVHVQGSVSWPNASNSFTLSGSTRTITTNDLPKGQVTGTFPIAASDPAHQYDNNPNHIAAQSITYTLPATPSVASQPLCLHGGPIGVTVDGVLLFDALDAQNRDAAAHEAQDICDGHPDQASAYHYHTISSCLTKNATGSSTLVGYALDGFGIYVERDASGNLITNSQLDACHGRVSAITWDGKQVSMYHYDATAEYPYTLGCFKGTPVTTGGPQR